MNWFAFSLLEGLVIAILCLITRHLYGDYKKAVFVNSRGYRAKITYGYGESKQYSWHVPKGEAHRLSNIGESPRPLTLDEAFRRATLEEERERLQLPEQKQAQVVPFERSRVEWR